VPSPLLSAEAKPNENKHPDGKIGVAVGKPAATAEMIAVVRTFEAIIRSIAERRPISVRRLLTLLIGYSGNG
jgi:hypothetical protein